MKNCKPEVVESTKEEVKTLTSLVMELIKSNNVLHTQMLDMCKNNQY